MAFTALLNLPFPGVFIQFKDKTSKTTRFWTPYRLADPEYLVGQIRKDVIFHPNPLFFSPQHIFKNTYENLYAERTKTQRRAMLARQRRQRQEIMIPSYTPRAKQGPQGLLPTERALSEVPLWGWRRFLQIFFWKITSFNFQSRRQFLTVGGVYQCKK